MKKNDKVDWSNLPPATYETITLTRITPPRLPDGDEFTVIVEVRTADYVPDGFTIRVRLDRFMFTADVRRAPLLAADQNEEVKSIALAKRLQRGVR